MNNIQALIQTLVSYFERFFEYLKNIFDSIIDFVSDIPLNAIDKMMDFIIWIFNWAGESCDYCIGAVSSAGSLAATFQAAFDSLPQGLLYCFFRSGLKEFFMILTCGVIVWTSLRIVGFVLRLL